MFSIDFFIGFNLKISFSYVHCSTYFQALSMVLLMKGLEEPYLYYIMPLWKNKGTWKKKTGINAPHTSLFFETFFTTSFTLFHLYFLSILVSRAAVDLQKLCRSRPMVMFLAP